MGSQSLYKDRIILITGAAGSIGSEIVRQLLKYKPKQIRLFDNRETELFNLQNELSQHPNLRYLLGDVRDEERLIRAINHVEIVFHAAALKHVPICEFNPFEAVKTNVYGTENVIRAALINNVNRVVNISTDKVTYSVNTMGATKLLAERLVASASAYQGNKKTIFSSVRFGNVLNSRGSVLEIFEKQIAEKKAVTITDESMTRFFMSIPQAIQLVFKAAEMMHGGETFVLKMPVIQMKDLIDVIVERLAPRYGKEANKIERKIIGLRPGERLYEDLMTEEEAENALELSDLFIILSNLHASRVNGKYDYEGAKRCTSQFYTSRSAPLLSKKEINDLLDSFGY